MGSLSNPPSTLKGVESWPCVMKIVLGRYNPFQGKSLHPVSLGVDREEYFPTPGYKIGIFSGYRK